jgi:hypothetical protein
VGSQANGVAGMPHPGAPTFSPNVKCLSCASNIATVPASPVAYFTCDANGSDST